MSNILLNDLLHATLKDLHNLHAFPVTGDPKIYESTLQTTIHNIIQLLGYNTIGTHLNFSVTHNDIGSFSLSYYIKPLSAEITSTNIFNLIKTYNSADTSVLHQIIEILSNLSDKKPTRMKDSYSFILGKFSILIEFFIKFHQESETRLMNYLMKCINYELSFYSKIQRRLESDIFLNEEDTQFLVNYLDSFIDHTEKQEPETSDDNSIFSYDFQLNEDLPLNFHCNNPSFEKIYFLILKLLSFKSIGTDNLKIYTKLIIQLFKKHTGSEFLELNNYKYNELKLNYFVNFLLGDSQSLETILPSHWKTINDKVLRDINIFPEINENDEGVASTDRFTIFNDQQVKPENTPFNVVSKHPYSKDDQEIMLLNLKDIIPLLNDFDLNFDLQFVHVFKYYLHNLYDELPIYSTPNDVTYIDEVFLLITTIVDFENEDETTTVNIKEKVMRLHDLHKLLGRVNNLTATILMRISTSEYYKQFDMKTNILKRWRDRTKHIQDLYDTLDLKWKHENNQRKLIHYLQVWFTKVQKYKKLELETLKFNDKSVCDKYLNLWNSRSLHYNQLEKRAMLETTKRFMVSWKTSLSNHQELENKAILYNNQNLLRLHFVSYSTKFQKLLSKYSAADEIRHDFERNQNHEIIKSSWKLWYNQMNKPYTAENMGSDLSTKLMELSKREYLLISSKYFEKWNSNHKLTKIHDNVKQSANIILLRHIFHENWLKKSKLRSHLKSSITKRDLNLKSEIFRQWSEQKHNNDFADNYYRKLAISKLLKLWKLHFLSKSTKKSTLVDQIDLRNGMNMWKLKYQGNSFKSKLDIYYIREGFLLWMQKQTSIRYLQDQIQVQETKFKGQFLKKWLLRVEEIRSLESESDLILQRKYLHKISAKYQLYNGPTAPISSKTYSFDDRITLKFIINRWKSRHESQMEAKFNEKLAQFEKYHKNPRVLTTHFRKWISQYNYTMLKEDMLNLRCNTFISSSSSKQILFEKWRDLSNQQAELVVKADTFKVMLLFKKFLIIWYERYYSKNIYLHQILEEFVDRKAFGNLQDLLRLWYMKYIKINKRNQQSCDIFKERWQSVKSKSILELWRFKLQQRQAEDEHSFEEANTSIISNLSPLANKSGRYVEDSNKSYLHTPLKQQVSRSFITPSTRTSPSKLQETTERMKYERIDALRKHFGKVKGTSTPRRDYSRIDRKELKNSKFVRLPPPSKSYSVITPPKPPNFEPHRDPEPEADYLSNDAYTTSATNFETHRISGKFERLSSITSNDSASEMFSRSSRTSDESMIATAKQLRRITPIMFPSEDNNEGPTFSPASKVRERLRNSKIVGNSI